MASAYPGGLDTLAVDKANATATTNDHPAHHNDLADAVNKIEAELGVAPSGAEATVKAKLALKPEPYGPDLVTGDSQTFAAGLGGWTEVGGGALTWENAGVVWWPANPTSTHIAQFVPDVADDYITLTVTGTFTAGVEYIALIATAHQLEGTASFLLEFGDNGVDSFPNYFNYPVSPAPHLVAVAWTPVGNVADPTLRLTYLSGGLEGEPKTVQVGWVKVAELRDRPQLYGLDVVGHEGSYIHFDPASSGEGMQVVTSDLSLAAVDGISLTADEVTVGVGSALVLLPHSIEEPSEASVGFFDGNGLYENERPTTAVATDDASVLVLIEQLRGVLHRLGLVLGDLPA